MNSSELMEMAGPAPDRGAYLVTSKEILGNSKRWEWPEESSVGAAPLSLCKASPDR